MQFSIAEQSNAGVRSATHRVPWRAVLPATCILALAVPAALAASAPADAFALDLPRMLRSMAVLKAVMALAALGVVWWRLAFPVSARVALAYIGGTGLMMSASVLLWQLAHLQVAGALFHVGMALLLVSAWRDMPAVKGHIG